MQTQWPENNEGKPTEKAPLEPRYESGGINSIIRFALNNRLLIVCIAIFLFGLGLYQAERIPIDVLPDLNRPRVTVMTECPGLAPEEVESLVTVPLETVLGGTTNMTALRSSSVVGLSTIVAEFDWTADAMTSRQLISERLQQGRNLLPAGVTPQMTPLASVMGQVMVVGLWDEGETISAMQLRTLADWEVRKRLLSLPGVSEVYSIGGDRKQFQVAVRPDDLLRFGLTMSDLTEAIGKSNRNVTGGYLTEQGPMQLLVRSLGRIETLDDLKNLVVKGTTEPAVRLFQVADVAEGASVPVGESSAHIKRADGTFFDGKAVILTISKQPSADTRELTRAVLNELTSLESQLRHEYPGLHIESLYEQKTFIELAVNNVLTALRDGAILVFIVVALFLMNLRTTLITIITIPLSLAVTCLIFAMFGLSVNAMTLGGLAIAIGELVDDAIVDVENIHRRLDENRLKERPEPTLRVVFNASSEIRRSIVNGTLITILVFLPIFFLSGVEGKLFAPLGTAYIVSLFASLLVSLTLTPVLSYLLLGGGRMASSAATRAKREPRAGLVLRLTRALATIAIRFSLRFRAVVLLGSIALVAIFAILFSRMDRDFMPAFNEGALQINLDLMPGNSLATSGEVAERLARLLVRVDGIESVVRKTGRSELDEHAVPVNTSELICSLKSDGHRDQEEIMNEVRELIAPDHLPGTVAFYDQPLQHLINHLRSGSRSQIAVKVRGDDLSLLRQRADRIMALLADVEDVGRLRVDPIQVELPQVQIRIKRPELVRYGLLPDDINSTIETAMNGTVATTVLQGQKNFEVLLRLKESYREDIDMLRRLPIRLPERELSSQAGWEAEKEAGLDVSSPAAQPTRLRGNIPLSEVADIEMNAYGPGQIDRENGRRQVVIQSNPRTRGAVEVKKEMEHRLAPHWNELTGNQIDIRFSGLFESEQAASQRLALLSLLTLVAVFLILYRSFRSVNLALQIMAILPLALVGAVAALMITGQDRTIPAMLGMISLCGIASRNGILLMNHYIHLVRFEGEHLDRQMIIRAGRERVAPVLMTALTSAVGLLPLALAPNMPGREILYPVATTVIGGLLTSTLLEFFVRPALFFAFGLGPAQRLIEERNEEIL
ncbi:MAG: efflux RND transporter permease subunit [Planctomycetia bacterium]|nr:efflux RND transporter permease subunit [Planctomycetia bacterium]